MTYWEMFQVVAVTIMLIATIYLTRKRKVHHS